MINRNEVLNRAADECMKELYSLVQPTVSWNDFKHQIKIYSNKYKSWKEYERLLTKKEKEGLSEEELEKFSVFPANWANKSITECIGLRPWEFYYLPIKVVNDVCSSYTHAYKLDNKQELLDIIEILKQYCNDPIIDKYIDSWTDENGSHPGYTSYVRPDNLGAEINKILLETTTLVTETSIKVTEELQNKFFEFLDMAGKFFNWDSELNAFRASIYLGPSPNTNKQDVIDNWKNYRKQDIIIDDSEYDEYDEE